MKAIYINDCQWHFIDNQDQLIFSFQLNRPITFLDIRKMQLASMIKGSWCKPEEIDYYLSFLHQLNNATAGSIVNFFELFNSNSDNLISNVPADLKEGISSITKKTNSLDLFLIKEFEKNELLSRSIEGYQRNWRIFYFHHIYTLFDLVNLTRSELLDIPYIGSARADEIEELLRRDGLQLKKEKRE